MIIQAVREDLVIDDIRLKLPRGRPITIPGNIACDSRDLGKLMSQNRIIELGTNPRLDNALSGQPRTDLPETVVVAVESQPDLLELRASLKKTQSELRATNLEVQRLNGELEAAQTELGQSLAEGTQLRAEISRLKGEDSKLSTILDRLDNMPAQVVVQAQGTLNEVTSEGSSVKDDAPIFVQKFDPPKRYHVKESKSDSDSVEESVKALGALRKKKGR